MRVSSVAVLGVLIIIVCTGAARAQDDNTKKIVGVWEVTKSSGDLPVGSTVEFTKDKKLVASVKMDNTEFKIDGTYSIEKDKLMIKVKFMDQTVEETATIKKLTDDALEIEDKDKKLDTFKRKK